jgi:hypothetical protein
MEVTATNPDQASFPGAEDPGTTIGVNAGTYSVDESGGPAGYVKTLSADCSGTIALGESKTCTITNRYVHIDLDKQIREGEDGEWKDSLGDVLVGTPIYYQLIVTNDGAVDLTNVEVTDPVLQALGVETCVVGDLVVDASFTCGPYGPYPAEYKEGNEFCNVATATGTANGITVSDEDEACYTALYWAFTPGFWKNHYYDEAKPQQNDAWQFTVYTTSDLVPDVFVDGDGLCTYDLGQYRLDGELTLLQALSLRGGGGPAGAAKILLRAGVASLLNASFHEVAGNPIGEYGAFPYTSADVIQFVTCALAGGDREQMLILASELDQFNNGIEEIDWP